MKRLGLSLVILVILLSLTLVVLGATKDLCTGEVGNNTWQLVIGKYYKCIGEDSNQYCSTLSPSKRTCTIIQEKDLPQSTISNNYKLRVISSTYISSQINYNFVPISPTEFRVNWNWKDLGERDKLLLKDVHNPLAYLDSLKTERVIKTCVVHRKTDLCSGGTWEQFNETHFHCNTENNYKQCDSLTSTKKTCRLSKVDSNCLTFSERTETDYFMGREPVDLLPDLLELKKGLPLKTLDRVRVDELNKTIVTLSKIKLSKEILDVSKDSGSFIIDISGAYIGEKFKIGFATTTISITLPDNFKYINDQTPTFNFTVSGDYATYNATLKIDGVERGTSSVTNNTASSITCNTTLTSEGIYNWSIEAKYGATSVSNSTVMYFTLDVTDPVVTINYPPHNGRIRVYNPYINFTYSETYPEKVYFQLNGEPLNYTTSPYLIDNHTVLYLKMNEGVGNQTFDSSDYSNDGTMQGASFNEKDALKFDGSNDYVNCLNDSSLAITSELTLEIWFKTSSTDTLKILSKKFTWNAADGYEIEIKDGNTITILAGGSAYGRGVKTHSDNRWHHLIGTISGTTATLYVDKIDVTTDSSISALVSGTQNLYLGIQNGINYEFNGTIGLVKIYNRSLSSDEVTEHYEGIYNNETGLVLHIPFTDNSGTNAEDLSGEGNNGTLTYFENTTAGYGDTHDSGWTTSGKPVFGRLGRGIYFDGNGDYIDTGDINISGEQTISAWIYSGVSSYPATDTFKIIDTEYTYFSFRNTFIRFGTGHNDLSSAALKTNEWYFATGVYNGTHTQIWINGVLIDSDAHSLTLSSGENGIIGASPAAGRYFNGTIDEVRIFDVALSAEEVGEEYDRGLKRLKVRLSDRGYPDIDNSTMLLLTFDQSGETSGSANGTTERDISGNNNDASVSGCNYSVGKFGGAMSFDGIDDYMQVSDSSLNITTAISLEAWVKPAVTMDKWAGIISNPVSSERYLLGKRDTKIGMKVVVGGNNYEASDSATVASYGGNTWIHYIGTYDGETLKLYKNGNLEATNTDPSGDIDTNSINVQIGKLSNYEWNGTIDQVTIYNRALSEEEIKIKYRLRNKVHNLTAHVEDLAGNRGEDTNKFSVDFASTSIDPVMYVAGGSVALVLLTYYLRKYRRKKGVRRR